MKKIQPVVFPLNLGTATQINCNGSDNYLNFVNIYYQLFNDLDEVLQSGNLIMSGLDYANYNTCNDGNQFIYNWAANELNVILLTP